MQHGEKAKPTRLSQPLHNWVVQLLHNRYMQPGCKIPLSQQLATIEIWRGLLAEFLFQQLI